MTQTNPETRRPRGTYARPALVVLGDLARLTRGVHTRGADDEHNNGAAHRTQA